ncbi:SGS-domain-containing protein [Phellopilus nigrolimitatus]|nr:SGS-domain-containing protein [Phellopilus nigrolimitatus]
MSQASDAIQVTHEPQLEQPRHPVDDTAVDAVEVTDEPEIEQPRHSFYETDEKLTLDIFDKGANPDEITVQFEPRAFTYQNGATKKLVLQPLKGEIDTDASNFTVYKVKIEVRLVKKVQGRWGALRGDSPDVLAGPAAPPFPAPSTPLVPLNAAKPRPRKNWDSLTKEILSSEKDKSLNDDPNVGGDSTVNGFFQQLYAGADKDTKKAITKSYYESGGTTLSTNWSEVSKGKVEVKPPQGSEWKRWG